MEYGNMYYSRQDRNFTQPNMSLGMTCVEEPLSDCQFKAYKTRIYEYKNYLENVNRLANCVNVCITEEPVNVGEHGLLTGESLNALQHAGSISVYNFFQQHNWEYPSNPEGEMACIRPHNPVTDEFLDSEQPIRPDWPAVHLTKCFIDQDKAKLHGSALPLRSYLPPTISFRNAADVDDTLEPEVRTNKQMIAQEGDIEVVATDNGIMIQKCVKEGKEAQLIPVNDFFYGRIDNKNIPTETKAEYRFNCASCQTTFYSNVMLMTHILGHFDETTSKLFKSADMTKCDSCGSEFNNAFELRNHMEVEHLSVIGPDGQQQIFVDGTSGNIIQQIACRICEKSCDNNVSLAYHLHQHHREREMPYRCGICNFYTSVYLDLLCHFKKVHSDTNQLICPYCLRTFTINDAQPINPSDIPSASSAGQTILYFQHMKSHKESLYKHCTGCTLNFVNKTDFELHRRLDHKTQQMTEGDMITGAAATGLNQSIQQQDNAFNEAREEIFEKHNAEIAAQNAQQNQQQQIKKMNAPEPSRVKDLSDVIMPDDIDGYLCLECGDSLGLDKHRRYLPCSMCRFGSCCSDTFNRHVAKVHTTLSSDHQKPPQIVDELATQLYFKPKPENEMLEMTDNYPPEKFFCTRCAISNLNGNALATHLVEDCREITATLAPTDTLVRAREQVEKDHESLPMEGQVQLQQSHEAINEEHQLQEQSQTVVMEQDIRYQHHEDQTAEQLIMEANAAPMVESMVDNGEGMMVAMDATEQQQQVIMTSDEQMQHEEDQLTQHQQQQGEQQEEQYTINIPENVQLKPRESLLLMILEDGVEEFIIVSTDEVNSPVMQEYFAQRKAVNVIIVQSNDDEAVESL